MIFLKGGYAKQYTALEDLYQKYKDRGFTILGFPCNQFLSQEPGTEEEIVTHCRRTYGVNFPIMQKIEVNGDHVHPVYQFLKSSKSGILGLTRIKWNFEKFLVDRNGVVQERYGSGTTPSSIDPEVERLLSQ